MTERQQIGDHLLIVDHAQVARILTRKRQIRQFGPDDIVISTWRK